MSEAKFRIGMAVYDRWWPIERRGTIVKLFSSSMVVRWLDGKEWRYDRDHLRFVEPLCPTPSPTAGESR